MHKIFKASPQVEPMIFQGRSRRKPTGGLYRPHRRRENMNLVESK